MDKGVVYIAFGKSYVADAIISARSIKKFMPNLHITIFSNQKINSSYFDHSVIKNTPKDVIEAKMLFLSQSPYKKTLYLDTDTFICDKILDLFDLLNKFDMALAHSPGRNQIPKNDLGIPNSFPEFNGGVILFNEKCKDIKFFTTWLETYRELKKYRRADQPSLKKVIYHSDLRIATLTPEYNCRLNIPSFLNGKAKILHGKCTNTEKLGILINSYTGRRIFDPQLQRIMRAKRIIKRIDY